MFLNRSIYRNCFFRYLLTVSLLISLSYNLLSQSIVFPNNKDSLNIHTFNGLTYKGSSYNYQIAEDEDGIMYFGNENGLLEFDGARWFLHKNNNASAVIRMKLVEDKIYVTDDREFGYFQRDSIGRMQYHTLYTPPTSGADASQTLNIVSINEFQGRVFFNSYKKIMVWDGEVFKTLKIEDAHVFDVGGELLFSVYGRGLAKLQADTLVYVNTDFKFDLDAAFIIEKQITGNWLIYTSEEGIYRLDTTDYSVKPYDSEMSTYFKREDRDFYDINRINDTLVMAHTWDHGIVFFNREGKLLKAIDKEDGLNDGYNFRSHIDRRGNIWLINAYGIHYLSWAAPIKEQDYTPKTIIRSVEVGDSVIFIKNLNHELDFDEFNFKSLLFNFCTPSFLTEELEYSYYLEGFEDDYSNWTQQTKKEYTNISGGTYTFKVKARYIENPSLEIKPFSTTVNISLPWYENKWNYAYLVLIVAALVVTFIRIRTQRLKSINKRLEDLVNERTSQLLQQQVQLKEANEELTVINNELDNFVYRSSHDLVAPLKSLRGLIQIAKEEQSELDRAFYFQLMNTSINKLEEFIKSIMDFSTNSKKPLEFKEVKLNDILDSIVQDIKYYTNSEKVDLIRNFDDNFKIETDAKRLHIVLSNLITNAVKYHNYDQHDQPYIKVSAQKLKRSYELTVEDNGQGIPEEFHGKIFDMFFRAHQGSEGSGLGLYIVVDTLKVLQGEIKFFSKLRQGTRFVITLPFQENIF